MDKTPEKVRRDKDPKRVEAAHKGREKYMNKLNKSILNDVKKGSGDTTNASNEATSATNNASNETTSATNNASNETTSVTNTATTRSNDTYVYGVGIFAVLVIGACVFFAYNTSQAKKQANEEKQDQPPKQRPML